LASNIHVSGADQLLPCICFIIGQSTTVPSGNSVRKKHQSLKSTDPVRRSSVTLSSKTEQSQPTNLAERPISPKPKPEISPKPKMDALQGGRSIASPTRVAERPISPKPKPEISPKPRDALLERPTSPKPEKPEKPQKPVQATRPNNVRSSSVNMSLSPRNSTSPQTPVNSTTSSQTSPRSPLSSSTSTVTAQTQTQPEELLTVQELINRYSKS